MNRVADVMAYLPWSVLLFICATLGLAPFVPEPHVWEKLKMLVAGVLVRPVDIADLAFHGAPWALVILKLAIQANKSRSG